MLDLRPFWESEKKIIRLIIGLWIFFIFAYNFFPELIIPRHLPIAKASATFLPPVLIILAWVDFKIKKEKESKRTMVENERS